MNDFTGNLPPGRDGLTDWRAVVRTTLAMLNPIRVGEMKLECFDSLRDRVLHPKR